MRTIAAILAGGSGSRIGGAQPKQMLLLGGQPVLEHSVATFDGHPRIDAVVIVCREDLISAVEDLVARGGYSKVRAIIPGGSSRFLSSLAAIRAACHLMQSAETAAGHLEQCTETAACHLDYGAEPASCHFDHGAEPASCHIDQGEDRRVDKSSSIPFHDAALLLHDAARPLVDAALIDRCLDALEQFDAVEPAISLADTVIRVSGSGLLTDVPPRAALRAVQTPQCFRLSLLAESYRRVSRHLDQGAEGEECRLDQATEGVRCHLDQATEGVGCHLDQGTKDRVEKSSSFTDSQSFTDDISVVRHCFPDLPVKIVDGSPRNLKLTVPSDLSILEALLGSC